MSKTIEDNLLREVVPFKISKVYLYDVKSGIEYGLAELKTTELDAKADVVKVRTGQSNNVKYMLSKPKDIVFNLEDVVTNENLTALRLGDGAMRNATASISGFHMPKLYTVDTDGTELYITLDEEPKTGEEVTFTNPITGLQIDSLKVTQDTTDKKKFVITDSSITSDMSIKVGGFKFAGKATDKYYNLVADSTLKEFFVVVETPLIKTDMTHICNKQYIMPRCTLDSSVNEKQESEPKEVNAKYTLTVMKPDDSDYLGTVYFKMI
jgi:hypothetical protein